MEQKNHLFPTAVFTKLFTTIYFHLPKASRAKVILRLQGFAALNKKRLRYLTTQI